MKRLVQLLILTVWLVGAVVGRLDVRSSEPAFEEQSARLLIDTDHVRVKVGGRRVVLSIETLWHSEWRVAASIPEIPAPNRSEELPCSESKPEILTSISLVTRSLSSFP